MIFIYFILFNQIKDPLRLRPISQGQPGQEKQQHTSQWTRQTDNNNQNQTLKYKLTIRQRIVTV